jgi:phosphoenolpyruvate carboxylase
VPESDIDETIRRLVGGLGKTPRELFDALGSQTIDLVLTAHPTQSVRRYAPRAGIVRTLSKLPTTTS